MFKILHCGSKPDDVRLVADAVLTPADFKHVARQVGRVVSARKIGYVAARRASKPEPVETRWNGMESTDVARTGDWIVTSLTSQRVALRDRDGCVNTYVILPERFPALYEETGDHNEIGAVYRAKSIVSAIPLSGGFDIVAPWGERQQAPAGYLVLNGNDVYGNNAETFAATFQVTGG